MPTHRCRRLTLETYGRKDDSRVADCVAYRYAMPDRPVRVVAVEPLTGGRKTQAFCSTSHDATAEQTLTWPASRWSIEETVHESKESLGFEQPQGWTRRVVQRTASTAILLYSLVFLWSASTGHRFCRPLLRRWY